VRARWNLITARRHRALSKAGFLIVAGVGSNKSGGFRARGDTAQTAADQVNHCSTWRAIQAGAIGTVRDLRTEWNFRVTNADLFIAQPWAGRPDRSNGSMGEGLSHELEDALPDGCEFTKIVSVSLLPSCLGRTAGT
jgi:hypothetical protein